jgi:hypothetical protein
VADSDHEVDKPTLTEWVAAGLATLAVAAIVWLAVVDADPAGRTALTGLAGAASSYFLTPKLKASNGNGNGKTPTPPAP